MTSLGMKILEVFDVMKRDKLDLHVLFEAAGNQPAAREGVLEAVEQLRGEGFVDAVGGDFFALTEKGRRILALDLNEPTEMERGA